MDIDDLFFYYHISLLICINLIKHFLNITSCFGITKIRHKLNIIHGRFYHIFIYIIIKADYCFCLIQADIPASNFLCKIGSNLCLIFYRKELRYFEFCCFIITLLKRIKGRFCQISLNFCKFIRNFYGFF